MTPEDDSALLEAAVREGGKLSLSGFRKASLKTWAKGRGEPVSEIDHAVNDLLKERLLGARPGYGWLSEESTDDRSRLGQNRVWIVDPIDGTRAFIRGQDDFTVTAALVEEHRPVAGAVFAPARDEFFFARKGQGAFLNGKPISASTVRRLAGCRIQADRDFLASKRWQSPWPGMRVSKLQSFALRLAEVAAGRADAAISARPKSEWDIAAADLIIGEAGGVCLDGDGRPFLYNQENTRRLRIIACGANLKQAMLARVEAYRPKNTS